MLVLFCISIRRECFDHLLISGEAHLRRILQTYACYYNLLRNPVGLWSNWIYTTATKENRNRSGSRTKRDHIMLKFFVGTLVIVSAAQSVQAQITVDISKITCEQFNVLEKQDSVAIWLSGYYHGQKRNPVLEINVFEEALRKFRAACRQPDNFKRPAVELIESSQPK
jgi:HdeA/HdeB family